MLKHPNTMRIVALPLTTPLRHGKPPGPLTYFHFQLPPEPKDRGGMVKWTTNKAASIWAGFGEAQEGTWKRRTFLFGERLIDRIDFMELSLKSVDPTLGPKLATFRPSSNSTGGKLSDYPQDAMSNTINSEEAASLVSNHTMIPLIYPGAMGQGTIGLSPVQYLDALVKVRVPRHRRAAFFWAFASPLTAPFMLIPIIPNLPFFFCAWRAWSNFRAYKASQYLASLIEHGAVVPERDAQLDEIYEKSSSRHTGSRENSAASESQSAEQARLILAREDVPKILELYELPSTAASDLYRAIEQASGENVGKQGEGPDDRPKQS